jgi:hypothetical protein
MLHSPVPLDAHGNPLPQEETKEILQTMMRLQFEGFIGDDIEKYVRTKDMRGRNGME